MVNEVDIWMAFMAIMICKINFVHMFMMPKIYTKGETTLEEDLYRVGYFGIQLLTFFYGFVGYLLSFINSGIKL